MKVYCDTDTLLHNIKQHQALPAVRTELAALEELLRRHRAGALSMFRSRVVLRELEKTEDQVQLGNLLADCESLEQIPNDERHLASYEQTDQLGGSITNPLVADVQDEALCQELQQRGLDRRDAEHVTQALRNRCDVFLTLDRYVITTLHCEWMRARFPGFKVRRPSELWNGLR